MKQLHRPMARKKTVLGRDFHIVEVEPIRKDGNRDLKTLDDQELVELTRMAIRQWGISGRGKLKKVDPGLYDALGRRKLVDSIGLEVKHRDWAAMGDDELVGFAKAFIAERGISGRTGLQKVDQGLFDALGRRKLFGLIGIEKKTMDWGLLTDEELIRHAKELIAERGIRGRGELSKTVGGLYNVLSKRKLLGETGLGNSNCKDREWSVMEDIELIGVAKYFINERKIGWGKELLRSDAGLYYALKRRGLIDRVGLEKKRSDWKGKGDMELLEFAKEFVAKRGIRGRSELQRVDSGLYVALRRRKLLEDVGLEKKCRDWASMSDEKLVGNARGFIAERRINGRHGLKKTDQGLYQVLRERKLLDAVFSPIESENQSAAMSDILDSVREFGGSE